MPAIDKNNSFFLNIPIFLNYPPHGTTNSLMITKNKTQLSNDLKWDSHYSRVVQFIQQNSRYPTDSRKDKREALLAKWLYHQRYLLSLNKFPEERLEKFLEINPRSTAFDKRWLQNLKMTIQFIKKNDRLPFRDSPDEKRLRLWYYNQYTYYRKGTLNQQRKTLLDASGILRYAFEKDVWKEHYNAFRKCITQNKRSPGSRAKGEEKKLADWYWRNKGLLKKGALAPDRALLLKKLIQITPKRKDWINANWTRHYNKLLFFKQKYGRLHKYAVGDRDELRLYYWLCDQKKYYRQNKLSDEHVNKLRNISSETFNMNEFSEKYQDKQNRQWFVTYNSVKNFLKQYDRFPQIYNKPPQERRFGDWCRYQKRQYHRGKLRDERHTLLAEIGFNFDRVLK